jgi:hypothetical protein
MLTDESRKPATILSEWRTAERGLAEAPNGSAEYDALAARVLELARAYADAVRDAASTRPEAAATGAVDSARTRRARGQG